MVILATVDVEMPTHQSIEVGYDLAVTYDDTLVVLYVMPDEQFEQHRRTREEQLPEDLEKYNVDMASETAAEKAADAVDGALDVYDTERVVTRGAVGSPADTIPEIAEEIDPRYVVVGGRKRSLAKQALFGSVSQSIIRNVEQPVVTLMEQKQ